MNYKKLMKFINRCITNNTLNKDQLDRIISQFHKRDIKYIRSLSLANLTEFNKKVYDYFNMMDSKKYINKPPIYADKHEIDSDFYKYEKYVYLLTGKFKDLNFKNIENIYGYDLYEGTKDLIQDGRLFLLEAIRKYGKMKNNTQLASKSTFTYKKLLNSYRDVIRRANRKKHTKRSPEYIYLDDIQIK